MKTLVKICGLTTVDAVRAAALAGADAIGLVFAESPRRVDANRAAELLGAIPLGIERIAVFRSPTAREIHAIRDLPFDGLQSDANSCPEDLLPEGWFHLPAFADGNDLYERVLPAARPVAFRGTTLRHCVLLDGPRGGGRGEPVDTARATRIAERVPIVLAGGLAPDSVAEVIRRVRPVAVDVSSGVESSPGTKDPELVRSFVHNAKEALQHAL